MKHRVDIGTDMGMIGAWDASRDDNELNGVWGKRLTDRLEQDAARGKLFFIYTGADGGGPVDVYVDANPPREVHQQLRRCDQEFLISLPTGKLVLGGLEYYRSSGSSVSRREGEVVLLDSADYSLRCWVAQSSGGVDPPSSAELERLVGRADYGFYRRIQIASVSGYFMLPILFLLLWLYLGWKVAAALTISLGVLSAYAIKKWAKTSVRFRRVSLAVNDSWQRAKQQEPPTFVFELHRLESPRGLTGGFLRL